MTENVLAVAAGVAFVTSFCIFAILCVVAYVVCKGREEK